MAANMKWVSLNHEEICAIKVAISYGAPFAQRISLGFAWRLFKLRQRWGEDHLVLHEIDSLENGTATSTTKVETQFKYPPLYPFWHKHFSSSRHMKANIGAHWKINKGGSRTLSEMIGIVAAEQGDDPDLWPKRLAHEFIIGAQRDRAAARQTTGDWIIFAKHEGINYYLDIATHEEGRKPDLLMEKLRHSSAYEFPFLFPTQE